MVVNDGVDGDSRKFDSINGHGIWISRQDPICMADAVKAAYRKTEQNIAC